MNRVVEQRNMRFYDLGEGVDFIPVPPPVMAEGGSPEAGEVDDFGTNTVEANVDEGGTWHACSRAIYQYNDS